MDLSIFYPYIYTENTQEMLQLNITDQIWGGGAR